MKTKKYIFIAFTFLIALVLFSCDSISNGLIYIEGYADKESYLDLAVGTPNYTDYTVVHENGELKETTTLDSSMISNYDRMKFYQVGEFEITVNAFECSCKVQIRVSRNTFKDIKLLDQIVTYDGKSHGLELSNDIPSGTVVKYDIGNSFTDVGVYEITATLINDSYATYRTTGTLTIEKAYYDVSNLTFEDKVFTYDGKYKYIELDGKLPNGIDVVYSIDGYTSGRVVNAGTYKVTATFSNSNSNYNDIEPMTATLTIEKGTYDMSEVLFLDATYTYDGNPKKIKITGNLPEGVEVSYTAIDSQDGHYVDINKITEVGTYYVMAEFAGDEVNYNKINMMMAFLIIEEAK